jgi:hypothetical protein
MRCGLRFITMFFITTLTGCPAEVVPQPPREAPECLPPDAGADAGQLCQLPQGSCRCEVPQ